jgi:hypothetical protein
VWEEGLHEEGQRGFVGGGLGRDECQVVTYIRIRGNGEGRVMRLGGEERRRRQRGRTGSMGSNSLCLLMPSRKISAKRDLAAAREA